MSFRIQAIELENFGNIPSFKCSDFSNVNLIIGENATGKTFLLKALYSAIRSMEEYKRGDDVRSMNEILAEKLRWTFQVDRLGDIVNKFASEPLRFRMDTNHKENCLEYQFSQSTTTKVVNVTAPEAQKDGNSIFIPAKEVLSLFSIILKSREVDKSFGFDDTYYDLVKALRIAPSKGKNFSVFSKARKELSTVISGKVDYDDNGGKWFYKNESGQKFSIGATSEGVKKISIMDRLLGNGYVNKESVLFIDELESALHPDAIFSFLDMISYISHEMGIQVFISTHSYFVVKKLFLIALKHPNEVTCISLAKNSEPQVCNLSEGIPKNSIIQASVNLYRQEVTEVL